MTPRLKARRRAAQQIIREVAAWAEQETQVRAVALVGSYARGAERMASDVDLMVLGDTPETLEDAHWFEQLRPGARLIRSKASGPVRERRYRLSSGLIVELGIAPSSWADVPLDEGTRRVLGDGHRILYDTGLLGKASATVLR
ncbi:nucleotidyltransferase domain-containing protein [Arthrobacter sp. MSA 4-2]|uniref:nucleotidyltransferase family protein n=1 Tax=Arthrobacter sp. MSA 4-2 TaxID=2794349 RepID=UPI0018E79263|nr:nucleotidyltransferase domain-containing protein [Arthrobacter sp. MSA 4-2]MBJ2122469.1 nucleotidyltransferase domain-containing protein [Arthrobacter sp. MSA 4-2]